MAADLEIRIGAELSEIKGALSGLQKDLKNVGNASVGNPLKNVEGGAQQAFSAIGRLTAAFATMATVFKAIQIADEFDTLNARLRIATSSTEEYVRAQQALFELSQRTRTSLTETVDLYSKIAGSIKEAKVGQETLLQVVETVNQAVQLSGATTQAAQGALTQLGQGLASGTLRGEELNSILEQTPVLADAIAKGMGITRGELRKYGEEGKITAQQVIGALQNQREEIEQQFKTLPLTVGQSVTLLQNSLTRMIGVINNTSGATGGIASVIGDLADYLASDEVIGAIVEFTASWSEGFKGIVDDVKAAVQIFRNATKNILGDGQDLVQFLGQALSQFPVNLRLIVKVAAATFAGMVDSFVADAKLMKEAFLAIFTDDTIEAAVERRNRTVNASLQAVKDSIQSAYAERQDALNAAKKAREDALAGINAGRRNTGATGTGTFRNTPSAEDARKQEQIRKAQLDAQEKLLQDSTKRELGILEQLYNDATLSTNDYYDRRQKIELDALDRAIATERERAKVGGADKVKALAEIELLERQKTDIVEKGARDRLNADKSLQNQIDEARIQQLENQGNTAEAAALRLQKQFADLIKRLQADGNEAGVKLVNNLIQTGTAKAKFDELKAQFDRITAELQQKQQTTASNVTTGVMTPAQGQQQTAADRQTAIEQLTVLNQKMQELAVSTNDPAIVTGAASIAAALRNLAVEGATGVEAAMNTLRASLDEMDKSFAKSAANAGVDALTGLFTDLASGSKSAGEALRDFVRGFVASMAQIAVRALATYAVLQLLDAVYPGLGKATAATMGATASVQHAGGMAGTGPARAVNPLLFAGAPRYHSGGMVGLRPDERPAILQTGEEVLSRADPRNQANGGGGANVRIINTVDPALAAEYFDTPAGEKTFINLISRNAATMRNVLA
jgi:tape measure domain-containing protein